MTSDAIPEEEPEVTQRPAGGPSGDGGVTSQNVLLCERCRTYMAASRRLPCGHVLCVTCIRAQTEAAGVTQASFRCPLPACNKFILVPAAGVEFLPPAGATGDLSAILARWTDTLPVILPAEGASCGVCGGQQGDGRRGKKKKGLEINHECDTCGYFLCGECWEGHVAEVAQTDVTHVIQHRHAHDVCCRHGNVTEHYCHDCTAVICYLCDVKQHGRHRKEHLGNALRDKTRRTQDLLLHFREVRDADQDHVVQTRQMATDMVTSFDLTAGKVKAAAEEARRRVDQWEKEQLGRLEKEKRGCVKRVSKVTTQYDQHASFLDSVVSSCDQLVRTNHRHQMALLSSVNETLTNLKATDGAPCLRGEITAEGVGVPRVGFSQAPPTTSYGSVGFGYGLPLKGTSPTLSWTWEAEATGVKAPIRQPSDLTFLPSGGIAVSGHLDRSVWVFDGDGRQPQLLCHDLYPLGIHLTTDGAIAVADGDVTHCVRYWDVHKRTQLDSWSPAEVRSPSSVVHLSDGSRVVLCSQNRQGYIYEKGGKLQMTFGSGLFSEAHYMAVDSKDRIIVSDQEEHTVFVFEKDGDLLMELGSYGDSNGCLKRPKGVCVDCYDNVIIADEVNDRVTVFDAEGNWCCHLVDNDDTVHCPHTVAYRAGCPAKVAVTSGLPGEALTLTVFDVNLASLTETF